jgi:hypothetical protein
LFPGVDEPKLRVTACNDPDVSVTVDGFADAVTPGEDVDTEMLIVPAKPFAFGGRLVTLKVDVAKEPAGKLTVAGLGGERLNLVT